MVTLSDQQRQAIDMLIGGVPKVQVAARLGVHRNTVNNWCTNAEFLHEMHRCIDERTWEARRRRFRQINNTTVRLHRLGERVFAAAEENPMDRNARRAVRQWLAMYRSAVDIERDCATGLSRAG